MILLLAVALGYALWGVPFLAGVAAGALVKLNLGRAVQRIAHTRKFYEGMPR